MPSESSTGSGTEHGMFPKTSESWIFIIVACLMGFLIGLWIKSRRKKAERDSEYLNGLKKRILAEGLQAKKKTKKNRKMKNKNTDL
jgi:hypothetical protein